RLRQAVQGQGEDARRTEVHARYSIPATSMVRPALPGALDAVGGNLVPPARGGARRADRRWRKSSRRARGGDLFPSRLWRARRGVAAAAGIVNIRRWRAVPVSRLRARIAR